MAKVMILDGPSRIAHDVQHLFESRGIEDIRKTESLTRKEVEDKRQELRKLIGARYRELIESADSIVTMKQNADLLFARISSMRGDLQKNGLPGVYNTLWAPKENDIQVVEARAGRRTEYATATRIKAILETPELIWTALSREKHLEATLLYHQAQLLHAALRTDPASTVIMEAMPIVPRQWAVVCQFPPKIDTASKEFLARSDQLPEQYPFVIDK